MEIRHARQSDVPTVMEIEPDASMAYASLPDFEFCVDLPVRSRGEHAWARREGLTLIAAMPEEAAGFVLVVPVDRRAHVLEIGVKRRWQKRAIGRALLKRVEQWALSAGFPSATLTTFRDPVWNAPFYRGIGYREIEVGPDRPGLLAVHAAERAAERMPHLAMENSLLRS
ncbi:MAG TPA: GNAT family N-acetyltransferase [Verrucomicrobiae bacterium]|nr:GNAT family N-acetyltransferase [Verrucomicrobiae bacterium]